MFLGTKNISYGIEAIFSLFFFLFTGWFVCILSIFLYEFFIFGHWEANITEIAILLDSPSTLAFQSLMTNIAFLLSISYIIHRHNFPVKKILNFQATPYLNLLIASLTIVSSSILIDQSLYYLSTFFSISTINLVGNLNLASILTNLEELNVFSFNLLLCLTLFISPILEELFFRGLLWNLFRMNSSFKFSLLFTSLFFAIIHFDLIQGIVAFILGLIYGTIKEKNQSILPCIFAHILSSFFTFFLNKQGASYGIGGNSYPSWLLISALLTCFSTTVYFKKLRG